MFGSKACSSIKSTENVDPHPGITASWPWRPPNINPGGYPGYNQHREGLGLGLGIKYKKLITYKSYKTYKLITQTKRLYNLQPSQISPSLYGGYCWWFRNREHSNHYLRRVLNRIPGSLGFYFTINGFNPFHPQEKTDPKNSPPSPGLIS